MSFWPRVVAVSIALLVLHTLMVVIAFTLDSSSPLIGGGSIYLPMPAWDSLLSLSPAAPKGRGPLLTVPPLVVIFGFWAAIHFALAVLGVGLWRALRAPRGLERAAGAAREDSPP